MKIEHTGFVLVVIAIALSLSSWLTFNSIHLESVQAESVQKAHAVIATLERLESTIKDAETGERGYVITGREIYLEPYEDAHSRTVAILRHLQALVEGDREQDKRLAKCTTFIDQKFDAMRRSIDARKKLGFEAACRLMDGDSGMWTMDRIRSSLEEMRVLQRESLQAQRQVLNQRRLEVKIFCIALAILAWLLIASMVLLLLRDIKQKRIAEEHLRKLNRELEVKNELLEEYAWVAAHDLKEPVRVMGTYAELIRTEYEEVVDEEGSAMLQMITESAKHALKRIDAVLKFSGIGRSEVARESLDLNEVLPRVIEDMKTSIDDEKASVEVGELPVVYGNRELIEILFQNLISNSLKYRGEDNPVVKVGVLMKENSTVTIFVSDNGIGLKDADPQKVFGMFKRLGNEKPGIGLGLSTVKKIATIHEGEIWFDNQKDGGATFFLKLPLVNVNQLKTTDPEILVSRD